MEEDGMEGDMVEEYVGECLEPEKFMDRWSAAKTERCVYFCALAHGVVIDASTFGSWALFVNHHCEAVAALTQ
eukprot:3598343-Rhodomonas_salina.1